MIQKKRIGIGLIGCGTVARYGHLPVIANNQGFQLLAVADTADANRTEAARQYDVDGVVDYQDLLSREDIDAVTITAPLQSHYQIAKNALHAGKHVFCEKPFVETVEEASELAALAREKKLLFGLNFEYRIDEPTKLMKAELDAGALGALQVMRFIYNWSAHGVEGSPGARRAGFLKEGGGAMDCGVHYLDLARFFSGSEFRSLNAIGQWEEPEYRYPGHVFVQGKMDSGVIVHIEAGFFYTHRSQQKTWFMQHELIGSHGIASWLADSPLLNVSGGESTDELGGVLQIVTQSQYNVSPIGSNKPFTEVYRHWEACLRAGSMDGSPLATAFDGSKATELMVEILERTDTERVLPVERI